MLDIIGVGICIACISYLCCIYTTTFVTLSTSMDTRRRRSKNQKTKKSRSCLTTSPNPCSKLAPKHFPEENTKYLESSSRKRCPCAMARCMEQPSYAATQAKRRICLVTTSFLDIDSTDIDNAGKCERPDEGPCCTASTKEK